MTSDQQSLWSRIQGLVIFGWIVALVRLLHEVVAPEQSMYFGVYWMMPLAYLYCGVTRKWDDLPWSRMALSIVAVAFLVWFLPNAVSYNIATFSGWEHGRFSPDAYPTLIARDSGIATILNGLMVSVVTGVGGSAWSIVWGTLLIWMPGHFRRRKLQTA